MRRFIKPTIFAFCMMALFAAAGIRAEIDYAQAAEDIEVMARIIDKTLEGKFPDEYRSFRPFSPFGESRGCQGIYLKGYGAVFMTNINFPMAEQKVSHEKTAPDDLWQQTRYELRGTSLIGVSNISLFNRDVGGKYDANKVEQLKRDLLSLIGTYAPNIRQLGPQESVVVALRGASGIFQVPVAAAASAASAAPVEIIADVVTTEPPKAEPQPSIETQTEAVPPKTRVETGKVVIAPAPPEVKISMKSGDVWMAKPNDLHIGMTDKVASGRSTLIVKVSKENIMAYKNGKLDFNGFMKQAEIVQY